MMGSKAATALSALQAVSKVDCDTLDVEIPKQLGPFVDCTSNQAIAYGELSKPEHQALLRDAVAAAQSLHSSHADISLAELAAQIASIKLSLRIAPLISGYVHVQTNPYNAYSTDKTRADAERIVQLFAALDPGFDTARICIKIPSTWEGIQACRDLEARGVRTLATTLFTLAQAVLAAEARCTYIAPYVNELRVHFDPSFTDAAKLLELCVQIHAYYEHHGAVTQLLPASLTSVDEIFALSGVPHITISPGLLHQLAELPADAVRGSLFGRGTKAPEKLSYIEDQAAFRIAYTRNLKGESERKLIQAINIFCDMQDKMEAMMQGLAG